MVPPRSSHRPGPPRGRREPQAPGLRLGGHIACGGGPCPARHWCWGADAEWSRGPRCQRPHCHPQREPHSLKLCPRGVAGPASAPSGNLLTCLARRRSLSSEARPLTLILLTGELEGLGPGHHFHALFNIIQFND